MDYQIVGNSGKKYKEIYYDKTTGMYKVVSIENGIEVEVFYFDGMEKDDL